MLTCDPFKVKKPREENLKSDASAYSPPYPAQYVISLNLKRKVTGLDPGAAMKKISQETRKSIIQLIDSGISAKKIAKMLHVSAMTVGRIRNEVRPSIPKPRGGRPGKISESTSRLIARSIRSGATNTAVEVAYMLHNSEITDVHASTVRRALHKSGMVARKKVKKPQLQYRHKKRRLKLQKSDSRRLETGDVI